MHHPLYVSKVDTLACVVQSPFCGQLPKKNVHELFGGVDAQGIGHFFHIFRVRLLDAVCNARRFIARPADGRRELRDVFVLGKNQTSVVLHCSHLALVSILWTT